MQKVFLYNTPEKKKVEFKPIVPGKVGIYSCGPTVYWNQHIGNMYAFVVWDTLVRILRYVGYDVTWVMNVTDVGHLTDDADSGEDKMEKRAASEGVSAWDIAKKYEAQFLDSLRKLHVHYPEGKYMPHATDYIQQQIAMVSLLVEKGFGYLIDDGVYYDTSQFPDYAAFGHLNLEELKTGASIEANPQKRNPTDFALWKLSPKDGPKRQMEWESPWGVGFPGWHIECTAMSTQLLGNHFDIHTGGQEHIKVHHTNEVAQGYGVFGGQTANYWLHNGWLQLKDGKMSKSMGNVYTVQDLESKGYDPVVFRYLALGSHYRKGMVFSFEGMDYASNSIQNIRILLSEAQPGGVVQENYKTRFVEKICDDMALSEAWAVVWEMLKSDIALEDKLATWLDFDKVLGLDLDFSSEEASSEVVALAEARLAAKKAKNWQEADTLRDKIGNLGYTIEDLQDSYKLKKHTTTQKK